MSALVTGAGSPDGIGFAIAAALARAGHDLVVCSTTDRVEKRASELRALGVEVVGVTGDLRDPTTIDRLIAAGPYDICVNNAGMVSVGNEQLDAPIDETTDDDWANAIGINLTTCEHERTVSDVMVETSLHNADFAAFAELGGAHGLRVTRSDQLHDAIRTALTHDGPALVEVITDPLLM